MLAKNARRNRKAPSIREREGEALVTLTDSVSAFRRDYRLGTYGSAESRAAYHMLIADWEARERRLPPPLRAPTRRTYNPVGLEGDRGPTVTQLIADYYTWARGYYSEPAAWCIRSALRVLRAACGTTAAKDFGPNALRAVRDLMIKGDLQAEKPRPAWCRKTVNTRIGHIVRMFKWAVSRELIEPDVHLALAALPPLKRGKTKAVDHAPIKPPDPALIEAAKPFMSEQVRALVDLQLLTGARPGELLGLRACDINMDTDSGVWEYRPKEHKNAHRQIERVIFFGPKAQKILKKFMEGRSRTLDLITPHDAVASKVARERAERVTPLHQGNGPGSNRQKRPARVAGNRYTRDSYRRAIERACDRAFPPPGDLAQREGETEHEWMARLYADDRMRLKQWRDAHRWAPNQLRHAAATHIRKEFGLEAAQLVLGHTSATITDAVYAERDEGKVAKVMHAIG